MLCPFCGDRRTEVLETVDRSHSTYRDCRCLYCKARFSTREKQSLGNACTEGGQVPDRQG
jgi:transcriptional regulator NrdR family protein